MVKIVLTLLLLVAPLASAEADTLTCAIQGSASIDSTIAASVYMFASTQRCDKAKVATYDEIKCEIDIASALKAVNDVINIISGAVNKCDSSVNKEHAACGAAVGSLTSAAAGFAAAVGGVTHWVKDSSDGGDIVVDATTKTLGKCVVNVGGVAHGFFNAASGFKAATKGCNGDDDKGCATNVLNVISILSDIGAAAAHITDNCVPAGNAVGGETGDMLQFVSASTAVATAGLAVEKACKVADSRLFAIEMDQKNEEPSTNYSLSLALAAFLPVAAVLGFVGGKRMGKRQRDTRGSVIHLGEEDLVASEFE